jgi:hypothetical protein
MVLGFPAHVHSQRQIAEHSAVLTVTVQQTDGMTQETTDAMLTTGTGKKSRYTGIMAAHPGAAHIQQAQRNG